jgi:hypothetical protein
VADVREQVALSLYTDFKDEKFQPDPKHEKSLTAVFDQVIAWGGALKPLRERAAKGEKAR